MTFRPPLPLSNAFQSKSGSGLNPEGLRSQAVRPVQGPLLFFGLDKTTELSVSSAVPGVRPNRERRQFNTWSVRLWTGVVCS